MQKHNKIFSLCLSILFIVVALLSFTACADNVDNNGGSNKLVIYNWAEYIYPDWETDFKDYYREKTGKEIDLTYVTFDTNETLLSKVFNNDAQVDVMCPSEYAAQKLMEGGYLKPLNYFTSDSYENAKYVNKHITSALERAFSNVEISEGETANMVDYMVPYMWGTLGILYNADLLMSNGITDEDVARAGWGILWNKDENGKEFSADVDKRILMKDSIRDSYAAAVLYMKQYGLLDKLEGGKYASLTNEQLINTTEQELIDAVQQVLIDQKDVLYGYEVDFGKDDLIQGNAFVDLAWSGDALYAIEETTDKKGHSPLKYIAPSIGANIWFDGWVMPRTVQNEEAAKIFIDFLNRPDVGMKNMMEIGYSAAVDPEAIKLNEDAISYFLETYEIENIPENQEEIDKKISWFFDNENRYVDFSLDTWALMRNFKNNDSVVQMWERVRSTGISAVGLLLYTLLVLAVGIGVFVAIYFIRQRAKRRVKIG